MKKIWIELERPEQESEAGRASFGNDQCMLANNMLVRLAKPEHLPLFHGFMYDPKRNRYSYGGDMGSEDLEDNGKWFNLEYLGRAGD